MPLDLGPGWTSENRENLTAIIERYGTGGSEFDPAHPPVAAFDWDDTVIDHDIGDAVMFYQIDRLAFGFDAPGFWDLIPDGLRTTWQAAVHELVEPGRPAAHERLANHPAYPAYRYLGYQLYREMLVSPIDIGYPWFTRILLGLTVPEVHALARGALAHGLGLPLDYELIHSVDGRPPIRVRSGLRYRPAMVALIRALHVHGFQVWAVSATNRWSIEVLAGQLDIVPERVIGMATAIREGRITTELLAPAPYFGGKASALRALLGPGARVVLAAGDSPNDERLLRLAEAGRLLVTPSSSELLALAEAERARGEPWLIQRSFGESEFER